MCSNVRTQGISITPIYIKYVKYLVCILKRIYTEKDIPCILDYK